VALYHTALALMVRSSCNGLFNSPVCENGARKTAAGNSVARLASDRGRRTGLEPRQELLVGLPGLSLLLRFARTFQRSLSTLLSLEGPWHDKTPGKFVTASDAKALMRSRCRQRGWN
jgi:hypothetical protein